ncbi:MAG: EpsG family protein [Duncaniella sp.]|nr:EpsG family protein [Duncaniella sp.]
MLIIDILLMLETMAFKGLSAISPYRKYFPAMIMLTMVLIMGLRLNVGVDYGAYAEIYDNKYSENRYALEPFWIWLCDSMKFIGFKSRAFFMLTALVIIGGYYAGMKKMSPDIYLSIIIFIGCGLYYETSNTIRQCCAQALLFAGTPRLLSGEWKKFSLFAICAMILHVSAIVGVMLMLLSRHTYKLWLVGGVFIVSFVGGGIVSRIIENNVMVLMATSYTSESFSDGVSSGLLKYVYNLIGVIFLLLYPRLRQTNPKAVFFFNMTMIGICIYNVFYSFMVMRRFTQYALPYITILLPMTEALFRGRSKLIYICTIVLVLTMFALKQVVNTSYNFDIDFF